ncbi:MAG: lectin-like protein [Clostridia bacterium]|nr:lectin-like protein [Clostridia bacterium]
MKKKRIVSLVLILCMCVSWFGIVPVYANDFIPVENTKFNGHTYYFYNDKMTWREARDFCEAQGGYLATFTSEEEWEHIHEIIKEQNTHYWFGAYGNGYINTWKWITGEEWSYADWCPNEPNNDYGGAENYLGTYKSSYCWNDYKPDVTLGFVCEFGEVRDTTRIRPVTGEVFDGHIYELYDESMTWEDAKEYCEIVGGHLVTITSEEEQGFIENFIQKGDKNVYWMGLSEIGSENDWEWTTYEGYDYENWGQGEPNNRGNESFGQIVNKPFDTLVLGDWNDMKNQGDSSGHCVLRSTGFICEYDTMEEKPILYKNGWAIANRNDSFGYDDQYEMHKSLFVDVYGGIGALKHSIEKKWNERCFGMSLLSAMIDNGQVDIDGFFYDRGEEYFCNYSYDTTTKKVFKITNNQVIRMIERAQISQDSSEISKTKIDVWGLVDYYKTHDNSLVFGSSSMKHAIVINGKVKPMPLEDGWYEFNVYDPNFPITDNLKELQEPGWYYDQEIYNNIGLLINPTTKEWKYYTYTVEDGYIEYGYHSNQPFTSTYVYDPTMLSKDFLSKKLKITNISRPKVYIYSYTEPLEIYNSTGETIFKTGGNIYMSDGVDLIPLLAEGENSEGYPIAYIETDFNDIIVKSENSEFAVMGNDNLYYEDVKGTATTSINISKNISTVKSSDNANATIKFGTANGDEYSIVAIDGKVKNGEEITVAIDKNNNIDVSGNTGGDFAVTADSSLFDDEITTQLTSEELRDISNISDFSKDNDTPITSFGSEVSTWAKEEVEKAYDENLIPETLVGKNLTEKITRAEFAAIAVQLYEQWSGANVNAVSTKFTDIKNNNNKTAIEKAYGLGITAGTSDTRFEPDTSITREQLATMLCRTYKKKEWNNWTLATDGDFTLNYSGVQKFDDDADISAFAKPSVYFMVKYGVISGVGNNKFAPKNTTSAQEALNYATATREQAILMALRSFENLK